LPRREIGEEIVCRSPMDQPLRKAGRGWRSLEVVFVLGKILRHSNQLPPDLIPLRKNRRGRPWRRLQLCLLLGERLHGHPNRNHQYSCPSPSSRHLVYSGVRLPIRPIPTRFSVGTSCSEPVTTKDCSSAFT